MDITRHIIRTLPLPLMFVVAVAGATSGRAEPIDFNRQVRPILSENCLKCHGPDEGSREARMRLDRREDALQPAKSGAVPIVPHRPQESELLLRVTDTSDAMPPEEAGKKLKPQEVEV